MTILEEKTCRAICGINAKMRDWPNRPSECDWEQRRYETARDLLCAYRSNSDPRMSRNGSVADYVKSAVEEADALIAELRKGAPAPHNVFDDD